MPRVSIVMPTKNRAALLERAIENCLSQTYQDLELIVVNDGSSDSTSKVLEKFRGETRLLCVHLSESRGLPRALNVGFGSSKGELLTWTSDDNAFRPNALERMVSCLDKNSDVGLVYANYELVHDDGSRVTLSQASPHYIVEYNVVGACFMYRRSVRDLVGYYEPDLLLAEDYDYWLRIYLSGTKIEHVPEVLYEYAVHGQSLGAVEGYDRVKMKSLEVRKRRLSPMRLEYLRAKRRLGIVWTRWIKPFLSTSSSVG